MFFIFTFYLFSFSALLAACCSISVRNPIHAIFCKVFAFIFSAVVWITIYQDYLALLLIIIYVGAVLVMFLFVVMILDVSFNSTINKKLKYYPAFFFMGTIFAFMTISFIVSDFSNIFMQPYYSSLSLLAYKMFSDKYLYIFELTGLILLVVVVSTISITYRGKNLRNKSTNPSHQVRIISKERLVLIKKNAR